MQLTVKLIQILPLQTGTGRNGEWRKQDIIVETGDQYPKKICVSMWGDKINPTALEIGNTLTIDFDVESREFNGRWYTDVKAWKVQSAGSAQPQGYGDPLPPIPEERQSNIGNSTEAPIGTAPLSPDFLQGDSDDLPF